MTGRHASVVPTLETDRLLLRPFVVEEDLDAYAAMMAEPDVCRYLGHAPCTRADAWRQLALFLGHEQLRGYTLHAVVERETGDLVGRVGLWNPEGWPGLEVGWTLALPAWGKGYATEAAAAWRDYAYEVLDAPELCSIVHRDNLPSARVAERIGHRPVRSFSHFGQPCVLYAQTRPGAGPGELSASLSGT
jgi:RimJ/RimL family protein N-acetyltransferase